MRPLAVFDIDGVLADARHRTHHLVPSLNKKGKMSKNWGAFFREAVNDEPLKEGFQMLTELSVDHDIVYLTGRPEQCRADTLTWLKEQGLDVTELFMRPKGNFGRSADTKAQLMLDLAAGGRTIAVIIDDDVTVVDAHRANGFNVIHATWALEDKALQEAQQVDGRV